MTSGHCTLSSSGASPRDLRYAVKFRESHLQSKEDILAWGEGYIGDAMGSGDKAQHNGVLIVTDTRVAFYRKGMY